MAEQIRRNRPRARQAAALGAWLAVAPVGCSFVPRTRLDDAQKLVLGLRSENAQLKDANLGLRSQNQDLAQRAVDDAEAIRALEAANTRYERSIAEYQGDRERLRAAFAELKDRVRAAANR